MASFSFPPAWPRSGYTRECRITERGDRNVRFAEGRDHVCRHRFVFGQLLQLVYNQIHGLVPSHVKNHQQTNSPQYQPTRQIHRKIQDICMYLLDRYDLVDMENAPMTLVRPRMMSGPSTTCTDASRRIPMPGTRFSKHGDRIPWQPARNMI